MGDPVGGPIAVPSLVDPSATGTAVPPPTDTFFSSAHRSSGRRWTVPVLEWVSVVVVAVLLSFGVRTYVAQVFLIPSGSMLPTLQIGERIAVDKLSYRFQPVGRGDIVVFRRPPLERADYPDLVKRVIGLPGDTVSLSDGRVEIDGRPLAEPWLPTPAPATDPSPLAAPFSLDHPYTVPAGHFYVMGDNRTDSEDSRYFGPIPADLIVGRMAFEAWPLGDGAWMVVLSFAAAAVLVALVVVATAPRRSARAAARAARPPPGRR